MIEVKIRLKAVSGLTYGSGSRPFGPDISFSELGVSPTSFRGTLRSALSIFIENIETGYSTCGEIDPDRIRKAHERMGRVCDVCWLFGYPESRGKGWKPLASAGKMEVDGVRRTGLELVVLNRIAIDEETGSVRKGGLFAQEMLRPGSTVDIALRVKDDCRALDLLLLSIEALRFHRTGRSGMVDVKLLNSDEVVKHAETCGSAQRARRLADYMWGEEL